MSNALYFVTLFVAVTAAALIGFRVGHNQHSVMCPIKPDPAMVVFT